MSFYCTLVYVYLHTMSLSDNYILSTTPITVNCSDFNHYFMQKVIKLKVTVSYKNIIKHHMA